MNRLRNRLILIFAVATLAPLLVTAWVSVSLFDWSLSQTSTKELDQVSKSLEKTGRELYQRACEALKQDAVAGRIDPQPFIPAAHEQWPLAVQEFDAGEEPETFVLAGNKGDRLDYLVRHGGEVWEYSTSLHGVAMQQLSEQYAHARSVVSADGARDLHRGLTYTFFLLVAVIWIVALLALVYFAHRVSRPIQQLTTGLSQVAAGNLDSRVAVARDDEIGAAIQAFNNMADELRHSRERLVYVTRLESWQALARKMAHEVKNSLTPIRLTMEEVAARYSGSRNEFLQQASQIVVDEVTALERRVRSFADFSSEPPMRPKELDINSLLQERISFLKTSHPEIVYSTRLSLEVPRAVADEDLVKGMLTNLLENAAQASPPGGVVLGITSAVNGKISIEVHDSGPGLAPQVRGSLFQPTISFKPGGMGLGLSIARRSAVLSGGDIELVTSEL